MNNEPDYKDNLAFDPEMTWEQLVEWAKDKELYVNNEESEITINEHRLWFFPSGYVFVKAFDNRSEIYYDVNVAEKRTPRQMKLIIEGLM